MPVLLAFVFVVFAEIAGFAAVGRALGIAATLALTAAAMLAGAALVRYLGLDALRRAEASLARGESPAGAVFDAACVVLAGLLLILPVFLSDALALMLLIRPLRRWVGAMLWRRLQASPNARVWAYESGATVVEGEYVEIVEDRRLPPRKPPPDPPPSGG
ncbi:MAG: FxsA family protein [Rhodospirillales bacterium]